MWRRAHQKRFADRRPDGPRYFEAHGVGEEDVTVYEALGKLQTKASKYLGAVRLHPSSAARQGRSTGEIRVLLAGPSRRGPTS